MSGEQDTERTGTNGDHASSASTEKPNGKSVAADTSGSSSTEVYTEYPDTYPYPEVGERWKEIQGENNWKDLLDPIDPLLRSELIRYGEFAQSTYDVFDNDVHTRFTGSCRFSRERLLEKAQIHHSGYEVTDYIYSTLGPAVPISFLQLVNSDDAYKAGVNAVWSTVTNWHGYVAVTTDPAMIKRLGRRDILIAWRGTVTELEWANNRRCNLAPTGVDQRRKGQSGCVDLKIEEGFLNLYTAADPEAAYRPSRTSARMQVLNAVLRLIKQYRGEELSITITGHSLGGALAVILGYDIAESSCNQPQYLPDHIKDWSDEEPRDDPDDVVKLTDSQEVTTIPVTVFTFGGPRVGNTAFRDRVNALKVRVLRVVNRHDIVPMVPGVCLNEKSTCLRYLFQPVRSFLESLPCTYIHVGESITIDSTASPFLKSMSLTCMSPQALRELYTGLHNLEGSYLHVLTGYQGHGKPFEPVVFRDLTLVNKNYALLLGNYFVPEGWWQQQFKQMVRYWIEFFGIWVTVPRKRVDYPEYFDRTAVEKECIALATPNADAAFRASVFEKFDAIAKADAAASAANQ